MLFLDHILSNGCKIKVQSSYKGCRIFYNLNSNFDFSYVHCWYASELKILTNDVKIFRTIGNDDTWFDLDINYVMPIEEFDLYSWYFDNSDGVFIDFAIILHNILDESRISCL